MSDTTQTAEQRPADLQTLRKQLEEMAAKTKGNSDAGRNQAPVGQSPVLVIRGK
jgi:hypothetical protein